jgi:hypothetical protein
MLYQALASRALWFFAATMHLHFPLWCLATLMLYLTVETVRLREHYARQRAQESAERDASVAMLENQLQTAVETSRMQEEDASAREAALTRRLADSLQVAAELEEVIRTLRAAELQAQESAGLQVQESAGLQEQESSRLLRIAKLRDELQNLRLRRSRRWEINNRAALTIEMDRLVDKLRAETGET